MRPTSSSACLRLPGGRGAATFTFSPAPTGLELTWRIDGVLQPVAIVPAKVAPNVVARLKVLAELLTYRTDVPQEGRIRGCRAKSRCGSARSPPSSARRPSSGCSRPRAVPPPRRPRFARRGHGDGLGRLDETSGAIVLSGPAGSGKTTTIYACLRELAARSRGERSLATLEDPIEAVVPGVAQAQVNPAAGLTLESGLKSLLRQDPEVIAIGEIRDKATAEIALQAALTGHLILTTFHAGSACEVIGRFLDMGIEPYVVRSGLRAVVAQRLVRRLCACASPARAPDDFLGLPVQRRRLPRGCEPAAAPATSAAPSWPRCSCPSPTSSPGPSSPDRDVRQLEQVAAAAGMIDRWERACAAVEAGLTSPPRSAASSASAARPRTPVDEHAASHPRAGLTASDICGEMVFAQVS